MYTPPFCMTYTPHSYPDTFAEVLGSAVAGTLPNNFSVSHPQTLKSAADSPLEAALKETLLSKETSLSWVKELKFWKLQWEQILPRPCSPQ